MTIPLVLASASPARLKTLQSAGVEPRVIVSDVNEDAVLDAFTSDITPLGPADTVLALARAKAEDVAASHDTRALVLGCDSMFEFDGQIYGKPRDPATARERWRAMCGNSGTLHTGHWIIDARDGRPTPDTPSVGATTSAVVHFAYLTDEEIDTYVATGEPLNVAGAFTIDGLGGPYVTGVKGDHHGVVGVSLPLVRTLLFHFDVAFHDLRAATTE